MAHPYRIRPPQKYDHDSWLEEAEASIAEHVRGDPHSSDSERDEHDHEHDHDVDSHHQQHDHHHHHHHHHQRPSLTSASTFSSTATASSTKSPSIASTIWPFSLFSASSTRLPSSPSLSASSSSTSVSSTSSRSSSAFHPPSPDWLDGTWYVTHTSLPLWENKRNVNITYTRLPSNNSSSSLAASHRPGSSGGGNESYAAGNTGASPHALPPRPRIDDVVQYQSLHSDKIKRVHGIDTPHASGRPSAWTWRGKGLLRITSSQWELLGYGDLPGGHQWAVTYFAKTMFTPEGIDVYSRRKEGLPDDAMRGILKALTKSLARAEGGKEKLVEKLYRVTMN